jgi:SulP family sulfate permease
MVPISALAGLLCLIGFRLVEFHHFFELIRKNWVEAISFGIATVGTLNNKLFVGLLGAIALVLVGRFISNRLKEGDEFADLEKPKTDARAVIQRTQSRASVNPNWHVKYFTPPALEQWMVHIDERPWYHPTSYVHPNATVIGRVIVEKAAHIAAEASVRADEGTPFFIGHRTNLQDGVVLHALKDKYVEVQGKKWAIFIDEQVSVAHQALIHGPCFIGARSFVGFKAVVHDSVVNPDCFVGIGAVVVGVEVPPGRFIPPGSVVDTQEKANQLPEATDMHHHINEEVVEVNEGLVSAYQWFE